MKQCPIKRIRILYKEYCSPNRFDKVVPSEMARSRLIRQISIFSILFTRHRTFHTSLCNYSYTLAINGIHDATVREKSEPSRRDLPYVNDFRGTSPQYFHHANLLFCSWSISVTGVPGPERRVSMRLHRRDAAAAAGEMQPKSK